MPRACVACGGLARRGRPDAFSPRRGGTRWCARPRRLCAPAGAGQARSARCHFFPQPGGTRWCAGDPLRAGARTARPLTIAQDCSGPAPLSRAPHCLCAPGPGPCAGAGSRAAPPQAAPRASPACRHAASAVRPAASALRPAARRRGARRCCPCLPAPPAASRSPALPVCPVQAIAGVDHASPLRPQRLVRRHCACRLRRLAAPSPGHQTSSDPWEPMRPKLLRQRWGSLRLSRPAWLWHRAGLA